MRFSAALTSSLTLLSLTANALNNKNGPFVLKLQEDSVESVKTNLFADLSEDIFNGLSQPLCGVLDGLGIIVVSVLDLLSDVVDDVAATVFYLTENGKLYTESAGPAAAVSGFSLNDQGQLLYHGEQLQAGFEGDSFKLKPKQVVSSSESSSSSSSESSSRSSSNSESSSSSNYKSNSNSNSNSNSSGDLLGNLLGGVFGGLFGGASSIDDLIKVNVFVPVTVDALDCDSPTSFAQH